MSIYCSRFRTPLQGRTESTRCPHQWTPLPCTPPPTHFLLCRPALCIFQNRFHLLNRAHPRLQSPSGSAVASNLVEVACCRVETSVCGSASAATSCSRKSALIFHVPWLKTLKARSAGLKLKHSACSASGRQRGKRKSSCLPKKSWTFF